MKKVTRRTFVGGVAAATGTLGTGCRPDPPASRATEAVAAEVPPANAPPSAPPAAQSVPPSEAAVEPRMPVQDVLPLRFPWSTRDPFLFCVHHLDAYPKGNAEMGPDPALLSGRRMGSDFSGKDGWSMYHGDRVPGFPRHPHRGFETITVVRGGYVDHSDSLGATARFGPGDAQWMTAGQGIVHAEMFPLRQQQTPNPMEFFQIWLNLPQRSKMVPPYFTMIWGETVPEHTITDPAGKATRVRTVAGALDGKTPPAAPPDSWASDEKGDVAVWTIDIEAGGAWTLPPASPGLSRSLYFFRGQTLDVAGRAVTPKHRIDLHSDAPARLSAVGAPAEILMLQGRPIGEPVAHHGPFVMNTRAELQQAFADYRATQFGGWPWPSDAPVHAREQGRFAIHADGKRETPA